MGKNRTTTYEKKYFVTRAGIEVPLEGHSEEWMKEFNDKIHNWIIYSNNVSPSDKMTDEELDYIFSHMNNSQDDVSSGMLTRVEKARHLLPLIESGELGVGSVLPSSSILRSYSKTQLATLDYVHDFPTDMIISVLMVKLIFLTLNLLIMRWVRKRKCGLNKVNSELIISPPLIRMIIL